MSLYYSTGIKLALGFICLIIQINLTGKGNLAPMSAMDQVQNFVLGGIIGGAMFNSDITLLQFFLIMVLWTLLVLITKYGKEHYQVIKRLVDGQPVTVVRNGQVNVKTSVQAGLSAGDLMFKLRQKGVYRINEIKRAVLEQNGQITVTLYGDDSIKLPLITDGRMNMDTLEMIDKDEDWLNHELAQRSVNISDIYLAEYQSGDIVLTTYKVRE